MPSGMAEERRRELQESFGIHRLGDEYAYSVVVGGKKLFIIGDEVQTEEDFQKQVEKRFGSLFSQVWEEAVRICRKAGKGILLSQPKFDSCSYNFWNNNGL